MERAVLLSDGQQLALNLPSVKIYEQILPEVVDRIKGDAPRDRIYELEKLKCNNGVEERTYQIEVWHKDCFDLLNVTVIQRIRLHDGKTGHVVLFSDDLELPHDKIILYYRLRFQIEFTFRDAKQKFILTKSKIFYPLKFYHKKTYDSRVI